VEILAARRAGLGTGLPVVRYQAVSFIDLIVFSHLLEQILLVEFCQASFKVKVAHLLNIRNVLRCPPVIQGLATLSAVSF
jgi:hypothetical protein